MASPSSPALPIFSAWRRSHFARRLGVALSATLVAAALLLVQAGAASANVFDDLSSGSELSNPTISSDRADYAPGDTVVLSGSGWLPGEHVHITVNDDIGQTWVRESDVTADDGGLISDQFQLPDSFIARYAVVATGDASGTAHTTFTDGNVKVGSAAGRDFGFSATVYSTMNCTGAPGSTTSGTGDANGDTVGVGNNQSVLITANPNANAPNASSTFSNWTTPGTPPVQFASGYSATDRAVCVVGFQSGNRDLIGNYLADGTPPQVSSINRVSASPTNTSGSLSWTVTFSESVTGVDATDFALVSTGLGGTPAITTVTNVTASTYTVTASTGTGSGTLKLNLNDNDSITDTAGNKLGGTGTGTAGGGGAGNGSFEGQTYTIDRAAPAIAATAVTLPDNSAYSADTWTNKSVRVTFTCTDTGGSGKATDTASGTADVTTETPSSGTTVNSTGTCSDNAGNTAAGTSFGPVKIDKTAPSITDLGPTTSPNAAGWYKTDVVNRFKASDSLSGLDSACLTAYPDVAGDRVQSKTTSGEGAAVKVASSPCTDQAGNAAAAIDSAGFKIDQTAPSITDLGPTTSPNANGWYKTDVTNEFKASDSLSGPDGDCETAFPDLVTGGRKQSKTTSGEGAAVTVDSSSCTDQAGNTAAAISSAAFKIDQTAPTISDLGPTTSPNAAGWYKTDVVNEFKASDSLSGPDSNCETDFPDAVTGGRQQSRTTSGDGTAVKVASSACTDDAGNTAAAIDSAGFKIDQTAPSISDLGPTTSPNSNGWYKTDVTNQFKVSDSLSGPNPTCETDFPDVVTGGRKQSKTTSGEGTAVKVSSSSCTDQAGNAADAIDSAVFKIDKSNPASHADSPTATNQTPFTVEYTASDQALLSGLSKVELYVRTPAAGTGYVLAATDSSPSESGESFTYTPDAGEGTYRFYTVAYDVAGNLETSPVTYDTATDVETGTPDTTTIFDQTPPVTTDNADADWHKNAVTVTLTATDESGGSGVDKTFYKIDAAATFTEGTSVTIGAPADHSNDGAHTIYYASKDKAGNEELTKAATVNIDTVAPTVEYVSATPAANANGWRKVDVTATFKATDTLSGFDGPSSTKMGSADTTGEGTNVTVGSPAFTDRAGNTAAAGSAISAPFKIDKTKPTLNPVITPDPVTLGGTATAASNAVDTLSMVDSQSCGALNTSTVGPKSVTCTATDKAGNTDSRTVSYGVQYGWNGFLQPINDTAHQTGLTQSRFKLGSTVPAKFVLRNSAGQVVQQATDPIFTRTNRLRACDTNATTEPTGTDLSPDGGAVYSWDGSQYHYNWSTKGIKDAGVYRIYANLADTTQRWVDICLW